MDDLTPPHWNTSGPSLGGCHGAELTERLGVWAKEIMRSAEALKDLGEHVAAGGNERLSEDLQLAATRLAELEAERDVMAHALRLSFAAMSKSFSNPDCLKNSERAMNDHCYAMEVTRQALGAKP